MAWTHSSEADKGPLMITRARAVAGPITPSAVGPMRSSDRLNSGNSPSKRRMLSRSSGISSGSMGHLDQDRAGEYEPIGLDELDKAGLLTGSTRNEDQHPLDWDTNSRPRPNSGLSRTARNIIFGLIAGSCAIIAIAIISLTSGGVRLGSRSARAWSWPAEADVGCKVHSSWEVRPIPKQTIDLSDTTSLPDWIDPAVPVVNFDDEGALDLSPLAQVCAAVEFVPGRWMSSEDSQGGIGNIRNIILTLLRYTIEGGAGLVMPSLMLRAGEINGDVANLHRGGRAGLDFFFDVPFLRSQLALHCPQMPIAEDLYHVEGLENAVFPNLFWPPDLNSLATGDPPKPRPPPGILNMDTQTYRQDLDSYFGLPEAINRPQILRLQRPLFQYPINVDSPAFFATFGRLLKLHPVAEVLASQALEELRTLGDEYMGAHLRLEGDVAENWGGFEEQTSAYLSRLLERKLKVIYVASGDPVPVARFKNLLAERAPGVQLVTKDSLLAARPAAKAKLDSLHFDQQALVDYLLLLKSEYLVGNAMSSFSVNLLVKRHLALPGQMAEPEVFRSGEDDRTYLIRDGVSGSMRDTMWA